MSSKAAAPTVVLVAHAPLAAALRAVAVHVLGEAAVTASGVVFLDVPADVAPERTAATIAAACGARKQTLLLTDLPHATPHNCAEKAAMQWMQASPKHQSAAVMSHCTAAMVLRVITNASAAKPLDLSALSEKLQTP